VAGRASARQARTRAQRRSKNYNQNFSSSCTYRCAREREVANIKESVGPPAPWPGAASRNDEGGWHAHGVCCYMPSSSRRTVACSYHAITTPCSRVLHIFSQLRSSGSSTGQVGVGVLSMSVCAQQDGESSLMRSHVGTCSTGCDATESVCSLVDVTRRLCEARRRTVACSYHAMLPCASHFLYTSLFGFQYWASWSWGAEHVGMRSTGWRIIIAAFTCRYVFNRMRSD
jgi:hypothetical protein